MQVVPFSQHERHHYGAGHGNGHSENHASRPTPPHEVQDHSQRTGGHGALDQRAWHNDTPHGDHFAKIKPKTDPKQTQHNAYTTELLRNRPNRATAWRETSHTS